jgi:uncharacterized membrane protein YeaQ/YmgE (transglycosylase-associated protein family)
MLILGILLFGMIVGAAAQLLLGGRVRQMNWGLAVVTGLIGSLVGGLIFSLLSGDGLELRLSGIVGSILGAVVLTFGWYWVVGRSTARH